MTDANSRRPLAVYLTFDPPSRRSDMMVIRECVRRHKRLPQILVVDGGSDFNSTYFEALLAYHNITKFERPDADPRAGSPEERLFGTTKTGFIDNVLGNTKALKNPREMTRSVDPGRKATWTLVAFYRRLCQWCYDVYDNNYHTTLERTPREEYEAGITLSGVRPYRDVEYNLKFLMQTLPISDRGEKLRVHYRKGVQVHYEFYWSDKFADGKVVDTEVEVRIDPFDISRVFAFVKGEWTLCEAAHFLALRRAIQEPGGASIINVFGPARVGKSTMKNHVIRTIILEMLPLLQQDRERVPLLSLMPRPPLSGYFSWKDFFQGGLVAFDEPLIDHKIVHDPGDDEDPTGLIRRDEPRIKRKPPEGTKDALRQSFETTTKRRSQIAIFVDEAQHLDKVSSERQNQVDCIKSLADNTGTIFVLIGTYELLPLRNLSAQLIGRSLDIHFPRYRNTEQELMQFKNVLRTFQDALPFVEETDILLKHWEFCYERSIGCVGNLRLMLVRAVHAALWADAKTLSWTQLNTHAFSEAESYEMMREAYEGESKLASNPGQRAKLRKMLGLDSQKKPKKEQQPDVPQTEEAASEGKTTQDDHSDEITSRFEGELPSAEVPADGATSELEPVSGDVSSKATDGVEPEILAEETPSERAPSRPLKKPKAEPIRPFRRKNKRDRTGGMSSKAGE